MALGLGEQGTAAVWEVCSNQKDSLETGPRLKQYWRPPRAPKLHGAGPEFQIRNSAWGRGDTVLLMDFQVQGH